MTIISKQCKINRHLSSTFSAHLWICLGLFAVVSVFPNHFSWEDLLLYEKVITVLISGNISMHCKKLWTLETLVLIAFKSNHEHLFLIYDHVGLKIIILSFTHPICSEENERCFLSIQ